MKMALLVRFLSRANKALYVELQETVFQFLEYWMMDTVQKRSNSEMYDPLKLDAFQKHVCFQVVTSCPWAQLIKRSTMNMGVGGR
jgi:hypothetical protein